MASSEKVKIPLPSKITTKNEKTGDVKEKSKAQTSAGNDTGLAISSVTKSHTEIPKVTSYEEDTALDEMSRSRSDKKVMKTAFKNATTQTFEILLNKKDKHDECKLYPVAKAPKLCDGCSATMLSYIDAVQHFLNNIAKEVTERTDSTSLSSTKNSRSISSVVTGGVLETRKESKNKNELSTLKTYKEIEGIYLSDTFSSSKSKDKPSDVAQKNMSSHKSASFHQSQEKDSNEDRLNQIFEQEHTQFSAAEGVGASVQKTSDAFDVHRYSDLKIDKPGKISQWEKTISHFEETTNQIHLDNQNNSSINDARDENNSHDLSDNSRLQKHSGMCEHHTLLMPSHEYGNKLDESFDHVRSFSRAGEHIKNLVRPTLQEEYRNEDSLPFQEPRFWGSDNSIWSDIDTVTSAGRIRDEAFVTLARNNADAIGCLVLGASLIQCRSNRTLCVLVSENVCMDLLESMSRVFHIVLRIRSLDSVGSTKLALLDQPELGISFMKLNVWRLLEFKKCVFMNSDTVVVQNCDELFLYEELSAVRDIGWPDCFNNAVFVFQPSTATFGRLLEFVEGQVSYDDKCDDIYNINIICDFVR